MGNENTFVEIFLSNYFHFLDFHLETNFIDRKLENKKWIIKDYLVISSSLTFFSHTFLYEYEQKTSQAIKRITHVE